MRRDRVDDERVDDRRDRAEPRPEVRDQLRQRDPGAEEQRVFLRPPTQPSEAEQLQADSRARADDQREEQPGP